MSPDRLRSLGAIAVGVALFLLAWALRAPLAPLRGVDSDLLSPVIGALLVASEGPLAGGDVIFGYGRDLGWWLTLLGADGLLAMARRRALVQALLAPAVFACVLMGWRTTRRDGALLGATLAGAAVAWSDDAWRVVLGHHQSYLGIEWGVALLAGLLLGTGRGPARWGGAALVGLALPMLAFNVPYALAAAVVPLCVFWFGPLDGRPDLRALAVTGVVAVGVALPHLLRLAAPDLGGVEGAGDSLLGRFQQVGNRPGVGPLGALGAFLEAPLRGPRILLLGGPPLLLAAARGLPEARPHRALAAGALLALAPGAALVVLAQHALPWHWLPLLPLYVACLGFACALAWRRWAGARPVVAAAAVLTLGLLVFAAERDRDGLLGWPADVLMTTAHVDRMSRLLLPPPGPVVGYQAEGQLARTGEASLFPTFLDGLLAGRTLEGPDGGPVTIYLEGNRPWLDAVAETGALRSGRLLAAGTHFVVLRTSPEGALALGGAACGALPDVAVRQIGAPEPSLLPRDTPREPPRALHPCVLPAWEEGAAKGDPVRQRVGDRPDPGG